MPRTRRPRREKVFGPACGIPLDRNAKARIMAWVDGYNVRHRRPRQHRGPITRAFQDVLKALLWGFHNSRDGRCFPSYERIAQAARCNRDTVCEAIKALEAAGILTWVNRIVRVQTRTRDLLGQWSPGWRVVRTSNAYSFRDPLPCARCDAKASSAPKSENPPGTPNQASSLSTRLSTAPATRALEAALAGLGTAVAAV